VHCSIGICLLYLLSITFLVATIALDEKRKDKLVSIFAIYLACISSFSFPVDVGYLSCYHDYVIMLS
jgi:hypothetical protein